MTTIDNPTVTLAQKAQLSTVATAANLALLLSLFIYWYLTRVSGPNWVLLTIQSLPLLLLIPGLWQKYFRSYSWLCFVILIYFVKAVDGAFTSIANWSDYVFVALTASTFISAMMAARWLQQSQKG